MMHVKYSFYQCFFNFLNSFNKHKITQKIAHRFAETKLRN